MTGTCSTTSGADDSSVVWLTRFLSPSVSAVMGEVCSCSAILNIIYAGRFLITKTMIKKFQDQIQIIFEDIEIEDIETV